ncbi:Npun_F0296 family exosortase-dependent surface protein [Mangrovitalea sediminis]|uniref:Npun_F0296 family exosortase-dependent surface protein n=1 Tax=Mangrovitalea sediminis TaxID=1982043 RepID=UPI0013045B05|nr:PEP-CTERM sorting domain-containing protein [Mangrovitalea sediminis]
MNTTIRTKGIFTGITVAAALGFSSLAAAVPVTASYLGAACPGTCTDLATAGYTVSGGAVVDPAVSVANQYKTPGTDTGNQGNVLSYNVTSSGNNPPGATSAVYVTNLNDAFSFYWGSIDSYNLVEFLSGGVGGAVIDSLTGTQAHALAAGSGSPANFNTDGFFSFAGNGQTGGTFDTVKLSSSGGVAFEFAAAVPEPGTLALFGLGLVALGASTRRYRQSRFA